jgi:hypothetical protein
LCELVSPETSCPRSGYVLETNHVCTIRGCRFKSERVRQLKTGARLEAARPNRADPACHANIIMAVLTATTVQCLWQISGTLCDLPLCPRVEQEHDEHSWSLTRVCCSSFSWCMHCITLHSGHAVVFSFGIRIWMKSISTSIKRTPLANASLHADCPVRTYTKPHPAVLKALARKARTCICSTVEAFEFIIVYAHPLQRDVTIARSIVALQRFHLSATVPGSRLLTALSSFGSAFVDPPSSLQTPPSPSSPLSSSVNFP